MGYADMTQTRISLSEPIPVPQDSAFLRFLYHTPIGRALLRLLRAPWLSRLIGAYMDSRLSRVWIRPFVRKNGIDLSQYEPQSYCSFNDFFTRQIRAENRPIDRSPDHLIAPCDGLLSAYPITEGRVFPIKQSEYTVSDLLGDDPIASRYIGGTCLVFRLCVNHYHRYCYPDDAQKGENHFLSGTLHTVRPVALRACPVFCRNAREYTVMETAHFGKVTQIEVGAMLVGKIKNDHGACRVTRGTQKGMFLYGGSTVVLLLEKDAACVPEALFRATQESCEVPVRMGEPIALRPAAVMQD